MSAQRAAEMPVDQLALDLPGLPPLCFVHAAPCRTRRPANSAVAALAQDVGAPALTSAVGERVWLVWEDDEVLGVYADPDSAAADCAALRRAARRAPLPVRYECSPVPVFTGPRHQTGTAEAPPRRGGRWQR